MNWGSVADWIGVIIAFVALLITIYGWSKVRATILDHLSRLGRAALVGLEVVVSFAVVGSVIAIAGDVMDELSDPIMGLFTVMFLIAFFLAVTTVAYIVRWADRDK